MSFEQYMVHMAFDVLWKVLEPQVPGVLSVLGFIFGGVFITGLVGKFLSMVAHSVANEGAKKK